MGTECFCSAAAGEVLVAVLVVLGIIKFLFKFGKSVLWKNLLAVTLASYLGL
jgi:hypothetical protein